MSKVVKPLAAAMPGSPPRLRSRSFSEEDIAATRRESGILQLKIGITNACNLGCPYCFADGGKQRDGELQQDEIKHLIDEAIGLGARTVTLMGGEPTLHPEFAGIVRHVRKGGATPEVFTNATLLDASKAEGLLESGAVVIAKLNSFDENVQAELAGRKNAYTRMSKGIGILLSAGFAEDWRLGIESIVAQQNIESIPEIWRWCRSRNIIPYIELLKPDGRGVSFEGHVSREQAANLFNLLLKIDENEFGYTWIPTPPIAGWQCNAHSYSCYISPRGEVQPCASIGISGGNVREKTLGEILKGEVFKLVREVKKHLKGACKACGIDCYGCRGYAWSTRGDMTAEDELCWRGVP